MDYIKRKYVDVLSIGWWSCKFLEMGLVLVPCTSSSCLMSEAAKLSRRFPEWIELFNIALSRKRNGKRVNYMFLKELGVNTQARVNGYKVTHHVIYGPFRWVTGRRRNSWVRRVIRDFCFIIDSCCWSSTFWVWLLCTSGSFWFQNNRFFVALKTIKRTRIWTSWRKWLIAKVQITRISRRIQCCFFLFPIDYRS